VTSNIENPPWGGAAGWFARRKGELLAAVRSPCTKGTASTRGAKTGAITMIDLVNSVRFTMHDAEHDGAATIALLSPLRSDFPALPDGHKFIGLWSFDAPPVSAISRAWTSRSRYDDAMADTLGLSEHILKLWEYDATTAAWKRLDGDPASRVTSSITSSAGGSARMRRIFAVSAPEPVGAAVMVLIASAALAAPAGAGRHRRTLD
jgi:hypothetical protein